MICPPSQAVVSCTAAPGAGGPPRRLSTTFQAIAAANGTTAGDVLTLIERAKVTATQEAAGDYTDTLTVIAAGRF